MAEAIRAQGGLTGAAMSGSGPQHWRTGDMLRAARLSRGLSLADLELLTGVTARHLEAIEAGATERFATPLYAVAYARAHAGAVGVSEAWVDARMRAEMEPVSVAGRGTPDGRARRLRMIAGGVLGALAAVALDLLL